MIRRLLVSILIAAPVLSGADKTADTLLELLREVGGLQEQIKGLQKSVEDKLAALGQTSAEQARTAAEQAAKATALLGDRLLKGMQDQQDQQAKTAANVAGLGAQLTAVTGDLNTMREALNDLNSAINKLSTQVTDLNNAVKVLQAPKTDAGPTAPPEISATDLWNNAEGDYLGGKLDLAMTEYSAFVTKFGNTAQAPDAQYRIASIQYSNKDWEGAEKAFDLLVQAYADSKRVPESLYYKGDCLGKLGRWPEATEAAKDLRKRFPNDPFAKLSVNIKPPAH